MDWNLQTMALTYVPLTCYLPPTPWALGQHFVSLKLNLQSLKSWKSVNMLCGSVGFALLCFSLPTLPG